MKHCVSLGILVLLGGLGVAGNGSPPTAASKAAICAKADPHLVAWWKLDETSGKTAADSSGRKHDGALEGRPGVRFAPRSPVRPTRTH